MSTTRHAVYYAPPPGAFADLGAAWLGWDIARGAEVAHPQVEGLPAPVAAMTEGPRRYGFHATLKPPFPLTADSDAATLGAALRALAARLPPPRIEALRLAEIGPFAALLPEGDTTGIDTLEAALVEGLDSFRAPTPPEVLARRRPTTLTPAQEANLARWGYPYVMEEFRFHMTLAGPLDAPARQAVVAALTPLFAPYLGQPVAVTDIVLAETDAAGRFHTRARVPLGG